MAEASGGVETSIRTGPLGYLVNSHDIKYSYRFKEDVKRYSPLIYSLEVALSKPLFCCGGSLRPPDMDKFVLKVKPTISEEGAEDNWKEFKLMNLPLDELLEYCNPAPFGDLKEMKTKVDSDVRLANVVESERFKIAREHVFQSTSRMIDDVPGRPWIQNHIEDTLTPGRYIQLDRYKLNVYSEAGFFKPHTDSPSGEEMIGTLVLCLPSPHKGGELCVNHDGLQHVFNFAPHSGDASRVQWAAFYSDCVHEVKPVLEGHRVTVTYNITLPTDSYGSCHSWGLLSTDELFEASAESPSLTAKALANVNSELEKIKSRRQDSSSPSRIGFLLKHKYISKGLQPRLLKGEDKALFDLIEKKWKCKLMSVLSRYRTREIFSPGDDSFEDVELDESHEIYEFSPQAHLEYVRHGSPPTLKWPWNMRTGYRQWRVGIPFIDIYRKAENDKQLVRNNEGQGKWLGNEVEGVGVDKIYLDSAVIIDL